MFFEKIPPHRYIWMFWWGLLRFQSLFLPLPVPIPDTEKNLSQIFIFTLLYEALKGFKKALKDLHKTFWCTKNKCENKYWRFLFWYNFLKCTVRDGLTLSQQCYLIIDLFMKNSQTYFNNLVVWTKGYVMSVPYIVWPTSMETFISVILYELNSFLRSDNWHIRGKKDNGVFWTSIEGWP